MSGAASVHPLHGNQMKAVEPDETVWLSASAGTGKTQVLSSRVLRLLLKPGIEPSQILSLTFTIGNERLWRAAGGQAKRKRCGCHVGQIPSELHQAQEVFRRLARLEAVARQRQAHRNEIRAIVAGVDGGQLLHASQQQARADQHRGRQGDLGEAQRSEGSAGANGLALFGR